MRLKVFSENRKLAFKRNAEEAQHNPHPNRAKHGITKYSDWTKEEFDALLGYKPEGTAGTGRRRRTASMLDSFQTSHDHRRGDAGRAPCTTNWADRVDVRDQGLCGDCWAFSTASALRSKHFAETGEDTGMLSTQFLVDCMYDTVCDGGQSVNGCCGGLPYNALKWIEQQGGIPTQEAYGDVYTALVQAQANESTMPGPVSPEAQHGITFSGNHPGQVFPCKENIPKAVTVTGGVTQAKSEAEMGNYVCSTGSYSVAVDASRFNTYLGGVLHANACGTDLDHAVLLVGVNQEQDAWVVQNSWGKDWGVALDGSSLLKDRYSNCADLASNYPFICYTPMYMPWCPKSCSNTTNDGGFIMLQYGMNTCGVAMEAVYPSGTKKI